MAVLDPRVPLLKLFMPAFQFASIVRARDCQYYWLKALRSGEISGVRSGDSGAARGVGIWVWKASPSAAPNGGAC